MSNVTLWKGDCLDHLPRLEDNSIDLIVTDPPYFKVKSLEWDRQWKKPTDFLSWLGIVLDEFYRVLAPNGSLYMFASPQMAWGVEGEIKKRFNVLTDIRWQKPRFSTKAEMFVKEDLRTYFPASETIIFAEHYNAESFAKGEAGYLAKCDELRGFVFEPLRAYLDGEKIRAGVTTRQVAEAFQRKTGSRTVTGMAGHWFTQVQWTLPTEENYLWLRDTLSNLNGNGQYLRREYEDLRREYEDLRREYEDLRRPFFLSADVPYTDVWTFPTVKPYRGKHPCEKPYAMAEHIIKASSRESAMVLDSFCGSGVFGQAAINNNRRFIGIDKQQKWIDATEARISQPKQLELV